MPYCIYRKASNGKYVGQYSVDLELLHILEKRFNFRSNLLHSNDNWAQIVNGSWTGVVGNIVNGISQIGMCMLSFTPERSRVIDFTTFTFIDQTTFISSSPSSKQVEFIFDSKIVWLVNLPMFVLVALVIYLIGRIKSNTIKNYKSFETIIIHLGMISVEQGIY